MAAHSRLRGRGHAGRGVLFSINAGNVASVYSGSYRSAYASSNGLRRLASISTGVEGMTDVSYALKVRACGLVALLHIEVSPVLLFDAQPADHCDAITIEEE